MSDDLFVGGEETLAVAKQWLRTRLKRGAMCPCCTQFAKVYHRSLNAPMAAGLMMLYGATQPDFNFIHITKLIKRFPNFATGGRGDFAKLVYWGMIEEAVKKDEDKRTSGIWRITERGRSFVTDRRFAVFSHVRIYDSKLLGFHGKEVTIEDCLKKKFSYDELMGSFGGITPREIVAGSLAHRQLGSMSVNDPI